jgi:DNA-binding transcriptional ArsR family regulator
VSVTDADIATVGAALGDDSRGAMLLALLGGGTFSAGELARIAGRSPSGATAHLRTLSDAGLVVSASAGRRRLFRLASPEVADALEALLQIAPPSPVRTLRHSHAGAALKRARTCYDHLAGELGVAVTEALVDRGCLRLRDSSFEVPADGVAWFGELGVDTAALERGKRSLARACVDWTERRPHLAGALGAALAGFFVERRFVRRLPGGRALALTPAGSDWLEEKLGLQL